MSSSSVSNNNSIIVPQQLKNLLGTNDGISSWKPTELLAAILQTNFNGTLNLCQVKWDLIPDHIFQWKSTVFICDIKYRFVSRLYIFALILDFNNMNASGFSSYGVAPASQQRPCNSPSPQKEYTIFVEDLQTSLTARYVDSIAWEADHKLHRYKAEHSNEISELT